jgi:hypothetical protein
LRCFVLFFIYPTFYFYKFLFTQPFSLRCHPSPSINNDRSLNCKLSNCEIKVYTLTGGAQQVPMQPRIDAVKHTTSRIRYTASNTLMSEWSAPSSLHFTSPTRK